MDPIFVDVSSSLVLSPPNPRNTTDVHVRGIVQVCGGREVALPFGRHRGLAS